MTFELMLNVFPPPVVKSQGGIAVRNFFAISGIFSQFSAIFRNFFFLQFPQFFRNFPQFLGGLSQFLPMGIFDIAIFRRGSKSQYGVYVV